MNDRTSEDNLQILKALVAELRGRLGNITERQAQDVGMWLLKAMWLGEGKPTEEIFRVETMERPALRVIK